MESFMKTASRNSNSLANCFYIKAALFHSTPVLDRKRRTNWDSSGGASSNSSKRNYNYSRRCRKRHSKHTLLRNVSEFAEHLFQSWQDDRFFREPSSSKGSRWFREQDWVKGKKKTNFGSQGSHWGSYRNGGTFHFCDEDDEDVEVIFRSAFGGDRCSYWSFVNDDDSFRWKSSSSAGKHSRNWRSRYEDDYDTYEEYDDDDDDSESNLASDRLALGLSASGPLKLEEVKNAYRACALKYHPDRHQGSSKAVAEEKFKLCSAAYQSLCDKMD